MTSETHEGPQEEEGAVLVLSPAVCWNLLRTQSLGRLAMNGDNGHPAILPVNYAVSGLGLFIKTAADSKLRLIAKDSRVTFEVDGRDGADWWSVVAVGLAHQVVLDSEHRQARHAMPLSASPAAKVYVIRVEVGTVTGRRFADAGTAETQRAHETQRTAQLAAEMAALRPSPIPHTPPRSQE